MAKQKEAWDKLSMQEKAQLIKLSVDNGVSSLKQIRDTYNLYSSGGKKQSTVNRPRDIDEAIEKIGITIAEGLNHLFSKENQEWKLVGGHRLTQR